MRSGMSSSSASRTPHRPPRRHRRREARRGTRRLIYTRRWTPSRRRRGRNLRLRTAARRQQDAPPLAPVSRWRRKCALTRRQSPLFHIRLDMVEPCLSEVDMHATRPIGTDRREEVEFAQADERVFGLSSVTYEEHRPAARSIAYAEDITLFERWTE